MAQSRYEVDIDPESNTSHALMLRLVGGDKRVLDVGCAAGDLARALAAQGCRVSGVELDPAAAEQARGNLVDLVIGDITDIDLAEHFPLGSFDVIVFGDVLEHLTEPAAVLRRSKPLLSPGGFLVISIPNVAHASVRLALLKGEFRYRDLGLLDRTHLRFFTRQTLYELLDSAGFVPVEVRTTTAGPYETELGVSPDDTPAGVLERLLEDQDALTYQFVLTAVPDDADGRVRTLRADHDAAAAERNRLASQVSELTEAVRRAEAAADSAHAVVRELEADLANGRAAEEHLARKLAANERELTTIKELAVHNAELLRHAQATVDAIHHSTSWRASAPLRALAPLRRAAGRPSSRRLRGHGGVPTLNRSLRERGLAETVSSVRRVLSQGSSEVDYERWIETNDQLDQGDLSAIRRHITAFTSTPTLSVLMPAYNSDPGLLRAAIASLQEQLYEQWELCVVDDASPTQAGWELLQALAEQDPRIKTTRRETNGGIAAATNDALNMATGDFCVLMDHDDVLPAHALYMIVVELERHPDADVVFSDEDKLDRNGRRWSANFKPDYNYELLLGQNYVSHLGVFRTSLLHRIGGLREDLDGSQDHDLILRATEHTTPARIRHVPFVLYHWRQYPNSGSFSATQLDRAADASRRAVQEHLDRRGEGGRVGPAPLVQSWNRVEWPIPEPAPEVTVVIPTRDRVGLLRACVEGLLHKTDYPALRILIVDNGSHESETLVYLQEVATHNVQVLAAPGPFNFSALNNLAVQQVTTPLVLLLNNDIEVRHPEWLTEMVAQVSRSNVGVVGAKLLYGDGRVQHGGVLLGVGGVANHAHLLSDGRDPGYFGRLALAQEVSAVTAACLLTRTAVYREVGGLDEANLAVAFNDVDYCLRVREKGWRILWTPFAELFHLESVSRGRDEQPGASPRFQQEINYMKHRWGGALRDDPAYNPNLSDVTPDFSLAAISRVRKPWLPYL